jgi:hypothetical protein
MASRDPIQETMPNMLPNISDDNRLLLAALILALLFGLAWWWNRRAKKWLEETGRDEEPRSPLDWLLRDVQEKPATPLKYSEQEFQEMVANALDEVPEEFDKEWNNVAVTVSTDWPTEADTIRRGWESRKGIWYSERTQGLAGRRDSRPRLVPDMSS